MTNILKLPLEIIRPIYEKTDFHKAVISELEDERLQHAYSHCRAIIRRHAKTFYMATRFLPTHKQRSIFAIYGLCRYLDDMVDEAEDLIHQKKVNRVEVLANLEMFKVKLISSYNGHHQTDPILAAFSDVLNRYRISLDLPLLLLEGVKMDLVKNRYMNFEELYDYSYKVASVVGLMTSEVFGYNNPRAIDHAIDLGIAMQLTNILRDVGEDLKRNRIYLPQSELRQFGISKQDLFEHKITDSFKSFMEFQIARTRKFYENSDAGIGMLNRDSQIPVALARQNYSRILTKIEENGFNVFGHRAYLSSAEKLSILPAVFLRVHSRG